MKKIILSVVMVMVIGCLLDATAQIRHAKGLKGIEIGGLSATTENGGSTFVQFGYSHFLSSKIYVKGVVALESGTDNLRGLDYSSQSFTPSLVYNFFSINQLVYVNGVLGFRTRMNTIGNAPETIKTESGLNYGPVFGGEIEIYLSSKMVILLMGNGMYGIKNEFGGEESQFGGGLKFVF